MAYAGQTIENPVSGEKITFIQTSADTDGELLEIELELSPDGAVPGAHIHPEQEERFEVMGGTMAFRMGLKKNVAGPGEVVTVPPARSTRSRTPATRPRSVHAHPGPPDCSSWRNRRASGRALSLIHI